MRLWIRLVACAVISLFLASCEHPPKPATSGQPSPTSQDHHAAFLPEKLAAIDSLIQDSIACHWIPGGSLWVEHRDQKYSKTYGARSLAPAIESATDDTIYDLASLTKVVATTPSIMLLAQRGKIDVEKPVAAYLPLFSGDGREKILVRHLLTHTSGLKPGIPLTTDWSGYDEGISLALAEKPVTPPGGIFTYSDVNFILLGEIVRRVDGRKLDQFATEEIFTPLGMRDTRFHPDAPLRGRIAPTEKMGETFLRGVVHDPTARRMGGVAGHAGVFSTTADLARFARCMLGRGTLENVTLFKPETVDLMTRVQTPEEMKARRGFGWDIDTAYSRPRGKRFPRGSYGHTGFTGTWLWIDPGSRTFLIFLSNRVHPDGKGNVLETQVALGNLVAESLADTGTLQFPGGLPQWKKHVLAGVDVLKKRDFEPFRGRKIGLITNHTGRDRDGNSTIDVLRGAAGLQLKALFSPEHGIRGERDESVADGKDARTGLPIYSLYGKTRVPTDAQLEDIDTLVFDIQDIGARFYTYIATMGNCMEAAGKHGIRFVVLDRPNPINGTCVEGPIYTGEPIFTAYHALPVRHGMTAGELAKMFREERGWNLDLLVVPMEGWERSFYFDDTDLPWTPTSPNMRTLTAALLYPGIGLLETSKLSVGRGTETPFEWIGAPYIHSEELARALNQRGIFSARFSPVEFTPSSSIYSNQVCHGVRIELLMRERCNAVELGLVIASELHHLYPNDFSLDKFNTHLKFETAVEAVRRHAATDQFRALWIEELRKFQTRRAKFLIYPP
jgi:uncharacterized protein YbbC (DUF1343 family)/CubicO group peptidase (beta-lactamase class C family)